MYVEIVILNYRTADLTVGCLRTLQTEVARLDGVHVTVVDGGSGDGSAETLRSRIAANGWHTWVDLLALNENKGFAYGNNAAIRQALNASDPPQYIVLLNPDTEIRSGAIETLLTFMDEHPDAGIAGSRLEDPDGTLQISAFRFPSPMTEFVSGMALGVLTRIFPRWVITPEPPDKPNPVDWVAGACMAVRREVFAEAGLMDDSYFLYFEEVDFCLSAKHAGWPTWYVPDARVVHLVGMASGFSDHRRSPPRRPGYWFESRRRFFQKNFGWGTALLADIALLLGLSIRRVRYMLQRKPWREPPHFFADLLRHSPLLRWRLS